VLQWSTSSFIELPEWILNKKATVNIVNRDDDKCFMWSILAHLHPVDKNSNRLSNYTKFEKELVFKNIEFPMKTTDIDLFE